MKGAKAPRVRTSLENIVNLKSAQLEKQRQDVEVVERAAAGDLTLLVMIVQSGQKHGVLYFTWRPIY